MCTHVCDAEVETGELRGVANARTQLFSWLHWREGRKGSLVVYRIPAATRDPPPPRAVALPRQESNLTLSPESLGKIYFTISQRSTISWPVARLPGAFPILLAEQFNLETPPGLIKITVNV